MPNYKDPFLSIVIPTYNEERRIEGTIDSINSYLSKQSYTFEIIIVDDGSKHPLQDIIDQRYRNQPNIRFIRNPKNTGKGFAVMLGVLNARGKNILFSDADLSTPIEEVEKLLYHFEKGYHISIGSRGLADSKIEVHQGWPRETMGKLFNILVQILLLKGLTDTQCGFKCFKRDVAHLLFSRQKIYGFCFDVEILFLAKKSGYRIREVPIRWKNSVPSKLNPLWHSLEMLLDLLKIRFGI